MVSLCNLLSFIRDALQNCHREAQRAVAISGIPGIAQPVLSSVEGSLLLLAMTSARFFRDSLGLISQAEV
jgi:hypothetical protein